MVLRSHIQHTTHKRPLILLVYRWRTRGWTCSTLLTFLPILPLLQMSIMNRSKMLLVMSTFTSKFQNILHPDPTMSRIISHSSWHRSMAWGSYLITRNAHTENFIYLRVVGQEIVWPAVIGSSSPWKRGWLCSEARSFQVIWDRTLWSVLRMCDLCVGRNLQKMLDPCL